MKLSAPLHNFFFLLNLFFYKVADWILLTTSFLFDSQVFLLQIFWVYLDCIYFTKVKTQLMNNCEFTSYRQVCVRYNTPTPPPLCYLSFLKTSTKLWDGNFHSWQNRNQHQWNMFTRSHLLNTDTCALVNMVSQFCWCLFIFMISICCRCIAPRAKAVFYNAFFLLSVFTGLLNKQADTWHAEYDKG